MSDDAAGRPLLPDETAGPRIVAATLIVTALALVTTCARLWVRTRITRAVSSDVRASRAFLCANRERFR